MSERFTMPLSKIVKEGLVVRGYSTPQQNVRAADRLSLIQKV